jgi:hypothetical protein
MLVGVVTAFFVANFVVLMIETAGPSETADGRVIERNEGARDMTRCNTSGARRCRTVAHPTYAFVGERLWRLERSADPKLSTMRKLSTVRKLTEALGGTLRIEVEVGAKSSSYHQAEAAQTVTGRGPERYFAPRQKLQGQACRQDGHSRPRPSSLRSHGTS